MTTEITHNRSLSEIEKVVETYLRASFAENTLRAYRIACRQFAEWCDRHTVCPLPADGRTIALYLADIADQYSTATVQQRLSAISAAHTAMGFASLYQDEQVQRVLKGIKRKKGVAQRQKDALITEQIVEIVNALPDSLRGKRDRSLILLGFVGAFRRGELTSLTVDNIKFTKNGALITLPRSKIDQEGAGFVKGIPFSKNPLICPVRALQAWLRAAAITEGPVFRSITRHGKIGEGKLSEFSIALIVKAAAKAAGLDGDYSGLSLRAGFATAAAEAGESILNIMRQTGHKSPQTLMRYVRHVNVWKDNPADGLGL